MKWDDLTMAQKSELMQTYIRNGVTSLNDMRSHFNTYANGGPKKTYKEWAIQMHTKYPWLELDPNKAGYDYEKYFNENYDDAIARLNEAEARHFTDRYKLPNHPTFSNGSIYSQGPSIGGSWTEDDKFIPSIINVQQHPNVYKEYRPYSEAEIYGREFATGGNTQPDNPPTDAISGPNRYWEKDPMKSKTGFYEWWLSNRQKQLENAALNKRKHMISMPESLIRDSKIKQHATQIKDNFIQSIRDYDEFIIPFEGINDSPYKGFENARVNPIGKEAALRHQNAIEEFIDKPLTTNPNKALNRLRVGAAGVTLPGEKVIYYPELGLWNNIDKSTTIHERNHAGDYGDNRMVDMIFWDDVNEYGKKFSNYNKRKQPYLLDGIKKSDYYDDAKEIKSRLMEFRYNNNLNPTHTYSIDEIKQMRNNEKILDENLLNRYNDDFIYHLLNDIAQAKNKNQNNIV